MGLPRAAGPQEILLAGCPTVGVQTGAWFVKIGETGVLVDRLPPGRQCVETDEDERALAARVARPERQRWAWCPSTGRGRCRRAGNTAAWGQVAKGLRPIEGKQPWITRAARDSEIGESFGRKSA